MYAYLLPADWCRDEGPARQAPVHPKESYNAIIDRRIESYTDPEPLSPEEIRGIEEALEELKQGEFSTHEQVKKDLPPCIPSVWAGTGSSWISSGRRS